MDGNINELLSNLINPLTCSCGSVDLEYVGMGEYKCNHCGKKILNDFGCVYEYVYAHPNASISDVAQATGVKEEDIAEYVYKHKIVAIADPRLNITCKVCGSPILLGDYCDSCRNKRANLMDQKVRRMLSQEIEPTRKTNRGIYTGDRVLSEGRMRFQRSY